MSISQEKDTALRERMERLGVREEDFRETFWNSRQADILGQIAAILAGGIAVVVLFRNEEVK